jgi:hypothetical protein
MYEVRNAKVRAGLVNAVRSLSRLAQLWFFSLLLWFLSGCATSHQSAPANARQFDFQKDTFAYPNELVWEYHYDANGRWVSHPRVPKPTYSHHCFVLARSARQFFLNARFDPGQPPADQRTYRRLIRRVISSSPRRGLPDSEKIVIPGYHDLREFSITQERLLKAECGPAMQSYFQRGHWRMIFPFTRHQQQRVAEQLLADLGKNQALVVHLARFPQLTINHAVVVFEGKQTEQEIQFSIYDPNQPAKPSTLMYHRSTRTFTLPANLYFPGGEVNVYEVYHRWNY